MSVQQDIEDQRSFRVVRGIRTLISGVIAANAKSPYTRAREQACEIVRDIPYMETDHPDQCLDVIRMRDAKGVQPALLYIHGGGFAVCTKESHEILTYRYAKMGFTVFSINYRLMPEYRFPAGFHDCCDALLWVLAHAHEYHADAERLVIAGESAGGNFSLALAVAASYQEEPDPWAERVYAAQPNIHAVVPACGALQVSGIKRLWTKPHSDPVTRVMLSAMQRDYLPRHEDLLHPPMWADPLLLVERRRMERALPPTFVFCGTSDVLLDDTVRLGARLRTLGVPSRCELYNREMHAFHALLWRDNARLSWKHQREFLSEHVPGIQARHS